MEPTKETAGRSLETKGSAEQKARVAYVSDQDGRGGGLVAAAFIAKGALVCEYSREQARITKGAAWTSADAKRFAPRFAHAYLSDGRAFYGETTNRLSGCYVNDFAPPALIRLLPTCKNLLSVAAWQLRYLQLAVGNEAINVSYRESKTGGSRRVDVVAQRDIQPGEALLTVYGISYWLELALLEPSTDGTAKAALMLFRFAEIQKLGETGGKSFPIALTAAGVWNVAVPVSARPQEGRELEDWVWAEGDSKLASAKGLASQRLASLRALRKLCPSVAGLDDWFALAVNVGGGDGCTIPDFQAAEDVLGGELLPSATACSVCGKRAAPSRCPSCSASLYCSSHCRRRDGDVHRLRCQELKEFCIALLKAGLKPAPIAKPASMSTWQVVFVLEKVGSRTLASYEAESPHAAWALAQLEMADRYRAPLGTPRGRQKTVLAVF